MTLRICMIGLGSICLAALLRPAVALANESGSVQLRMSGALAVAPKPRPVRKSPPEADQPEALARYYFITYPELETPQEIVPVLAEHYLDLHPEKQMPPGLLEAMAHYYGVLHPEKRPPARLYSRLRAQGKLEADQDS